MTARPLLYHEWRRQNGNGTRNGYNDYLRELRMGNDPVTAGIVDKLYGDDKPGKIDPGRLNRLVAEQEAAASERTYTRDEVLTAVNAGAQLVQDDDGIHLSGRDTDLVNLVVNAAGSMLDDPPPASVDEVAERCYQPDPECAVCGDEVTENDDGRYAHRSPPQPEDEHEPVVKSIGDVVRGWISGDYS